MARRYGRLNKYDSRLRRCARSGFRFYESEMVFIDGKWIYRKYVDEDEGVRRSARLRRINT